MRVNVQSSSHHVHVVVPYIKLARNQVYQKHRLSPSFLPGGVAQNRSIIMHMLSQARVGMDLTRITLPTFILEKRSLLEMYAEFFAHPDLFAA